jgi:phosphodiesterase/alkaline phosphatase D-like protein
MIHRRDPVRCRSLRAGAAALGGAALPPGAAAQAAPGIVASDSVRPVAAQGWEFVSGPLNAGSFGPNTRDATLGPRAAFVKAPPAGQANLSPHSGPHFFGEVPSDSRSGDLTVDPRDLAGTSVFSKTLQARLG